jgi:carbon-monoxide dehydrogenase large subunit
MTVFGAAKVPFLTRRTLAATMDLPLDCIDMIEVDVGGGFGVRGEFYPEDYLVPFASRKLNRPVKWVEDRRENLIGSNHSREMDADLEIICERNGKLLALRGEVFVDAGAYFRSTGDVPPRNVAQFLSGPYDIPNIHVECTVFVTNKTPIGSYRGPGRFEADFFRERLFDIAARELGMDPVDFRRINLVKRSQMPFAFATIDKPDRSEALDSGDYEITLNRCMQEFRWAEKLALQGRFIEGKYHGIGLGCFVDGGGAGPKENARIEIEADGRISVYVGSANVGQGVVTILTQIAAEALEVPMDRIRILHGSTIYLKEGFGSFHDRSTVMGGNAVLKTAAALRQKIQEAAASTWNCAPVDVHIGRGLTATYGGKTLTSAQLGKLKVRAEGEFSNHLHTYAYGAAAAHVTVDGGTGAVEVVEYVAVEDIGRIINPMTAKGQAVGGVVQGLGGVFLEHLVYDSEGQFLTGTLADYAMPSAASFPSIRAFVLENSPSPNNPLGAKGTGNGGIIPVGGVVSNAVSAALASLHVEVTALPLSPPRVWQLLHPPE